MFIVQLMRLVDMLVALSISEDAIYPLIQSKVWAKIGGEPRLLKRVLDSFIRVGQYLFIVSQKNYMYITFTKYTHTCTISNFTCIKVLHVPHGRILVGVFV